MLEILLLLAGVGSIVEGIAAEWRGRRKRAAAMIIGGAMAASWAVVQIHNDIVAPLAVNLGR